MKFRKFFICLFNNLLISLCDSSCDSYVCCTYSSPVSTSIKNTCIQMSSSEFKQQRLASLCYLGLKLPPCYIIIKSNLLYCPPCHSCPVNPLQLKRLLFIPPPPPPPYLLYNSTSNHHSCFKLSRVHNFKKVVSSLVLSK